MLVWQFPVLGRAMNYSLQVPNLIDLVSLSVDVYQYCVELRERCGSLSTSWYGRPLYLKVGL